MFDSNPEQTMLADQAKYKAAVDKVRSESSGIVKALQVRFC